MGLARAVGLGKKGSGGRGASGCLREIIQYVAYYVCDNCGPYSEKYRVDWRVLGCMHGQVGVVRFLPTIV